MKPVDFGIIDEGSYIALIIRGDVGGGRYKTGSIFKFEGITYGEFMSVHSVSLNIFLPNVKRSKMDNDADRFRYIYKNEAKLFS